MSTGDAAADLAARAFDPLPLGQVRPAGWPADRLRIRADGLHGRLDEVAEFSLLAR